MATALLTARVDVSLVIRFALPVRVTESEFRVCFKSPALAEVPSAMELLPLALASSPIAMTPFLSSCSSVPVTSGFVLVAFSNVNALADDTISSNLALQALNAQSAFAVSQMVLGGFWTPAEAFGAELEAHSTGDLQTMLDQLVEQALAG